MGLLGVTIWLTYKNTVELTEDRPNAHQQKHLIIQAQNLSKHARTNADLSIIPMPGTEQSTDSICEQDAHTQKTTQALTIWAGCRDLTVKQTQTNKLALLLTRVPGSVNVWCNVDTGGEERNMKANISKAQREQDKKGKRNMTGKQKKRMKKSVRQ